MKRLMPFVLVFASALAAQQPAEPPVVARPPVIDVTSMVLDFVPAPDGAPDGLLDSIAALYKREIFVRNADGSVIGPRIDMDQCGGGYIIYDTSDCVAALKAAVAKAVAAVPQATAASLRTAMYSPRNVDVKRLAEALSPLVRKVMVPGAPGRGRESRQNMNVQTSPALISLQDTPEQVERMLALLAELDQPAPQFLIQGYVLGTSSTESDAQTGLPAELVDNLHRLLPVRGFTSLGTVLMRASVEPGVEQTLKGKLSTGETFQVTLLPGGLDLANHRISLQRLLFDSEGQTFETSAVIGLDEYTVIGGAGSDPKLLVLRVSNLSGK